MALGCGACPRSSSPGATRSTASSTSKPPTLAQDAVVLQTDGTTLVSDNMFQPVLVVARIRYASPVLDESVNVFAGALGDGQLDDCSANTTLNCGGSAAGTRRPRSSRSMSSVAR